MKKSYLTRRPWYDNGARDGQYTRRERSTLAGLAADREGRALLESYCRIYRKKL